MPRLYHHAMFPAPRTVAQPLSAARRRAVRVAIAASLVLVVLATAYLRTTLRYQLIPGSFEEGPGADSRVTAGDVTEYRYVARPGRTIEYAFTIENPGPWTVRLEEMAIRNGPYTVEPVRVDTEFENGSSPGFGAVPFRPMDLPPNRTIEVLVTLRLSESAATPDTECSRFAFNTNRVRFTVLGVSREQYVPMGHFIGFVIPRAADGQPCADYE